MSKYGEGGKGCRHQYPEEDEKHEPTVEGEGVAQGEHDVRQRRRCISRWRPCFPEILRLAPDEGISDRLIIPLVGKVLQGAPGQG